MREPLLYVLLVLRVVDELVLRVAVERLVLRVAVDVVLLCGWRATVAVLLPEPVLLPVERVAVALVERVVVALVVRLVDAVERAFVAVARLALSERLTACERLACEPSARLALCERATAVFVLPNVRLLADWRLSARCALLMDERAEPLLTASWRIRTPDVLRISRALLMPLLRWLNERSG